MTVHLFCERLGTYFSFFASDPPPALSSQLDTKCRHYVTSFRSRKFQQKDKAFVDPVSRRSGRFGFRLPNQ
jgi:hypothetical protein